MSMKHFRYRKVTPEMKAEMKRLREQGLSQKKIGEKLGVHQSTVCYHLNPEYREKSIEMEKARQKTEKCREYQTKRDKSEEGRKYRREYGRERYHNDPEFRRKMLRANSGGKFSE